MEPIRILYVNGGIMSRGGIESYMMNYYRNIDRDKIQIDFIVHGFEKGVYDDEIMSLGGRIYNVPVKSKDYFGNIRDLRKIFSSGQYKIVHSHMDAMSTVVLKEAKKCGIPIRIAHSHNTQHLTNSKIKFLMNEYARKRVKSYASHFFACSEDAAMWLFGRGLTNSGKVKIVHNAIDINKFKFNDTTRNKLRKELNIENNFIIGHVGRFDYQKNHLFLLEIFKETLKNINNAKLVLVGEGHLKEEILKKIKDLKIEDSVMLLGGRCDVHNIFNIFDMFLFPSLFEGLGIVLIEAQVNGLKCITSNGVPSCVDINDSTTFLDLEDSYTKWAEVIKDISEISEYRIIDENIYKECGYDIVTEAIKLEKLYISLLEGN